jgi:hypothetical protein
MGNPLNEVFTAIETRGMASVVGGHVGNNPANAPFIQTCTQGLPFPAGHVYAVRVLVGVP